MDLEHFIGLVRGWEMWRAGERVEGCEDEDEDVDAERIGAAREARFWWRMF